MAHFAKVNSGKVLKVIVAEQDYINSIVDDTPGPWIQCSYNTHNGVHFDPQTGNPSEDQSKALRHNFPSSDWNYDYDLDIFYPPQPYPSWSFNKESLEWEAPISKPNGAYRWNENTQTWVQSA